MSAEVIGFWILASTLIGSALGVVLTKNLFHSVLWLALGSPREDPARSRLAVAGVIAMLTIVAAMLVWLTPQIVSLGRSLDFVPRDPAPPGMRRFWVLHAAYTSLEMIKLLVGVWVTCQLSSAR